MLTDYIRQVREATHQVGFKTDIPDNFFKVFLDAGHGGWDNEHGYATAPAKMWKHKKGQFHYNGEFYEGHWNRIIVCTVQSLCDNADIPCRIVSDEWIDSSLQDRCTRANSDSLDYHFPIFVSTHSNADPTGRARGYEIFTSPGLTDSDEIAEIIFHNTKMLFGKEIKNYRIDISDEDSDKEANFYVLRNTIMPAVLIEHLFFSNYDDAKMLMRYDVQMRFAMAQYLAISQYRQILWSRHKEIYQESA